MERAKPVILGEMGGVFRRELGRMDRGEIGVGIGGKTVLLVKVQLRMRV